MGCNTYKTCDPFSLTWLNLNLSSFDDFKRSHASDCRMSFLIIQAKVFTRIDSSLHSSKFLLLFLVLGLQISEAPRSIISSTK